MNSTRSCALFGVLLCSTLPSLPKTGYISSAGERSRARASCQHRPETKPAGIYFKSCQRKKWIWARSGYDTAREALEASESAFAPDADVALRRSPEGDDERSEDEEEEEDVAVRDVAVEDAAVSSDGPTLILDCEDVLRIMPRQALPSDVCATASRGESREARCEGPIALLRARDQGGKDLWIHIPTSYRPRFREEFKRKESALRAAAEIPRPTSVSGRAACWGLPRSSISVSRAFAVSDIFGLTMKTCF